jgi:hypothetical protein
LAVEPRAVDPHCFDADPEPDPAQNLDADPDPDPNPDLGGWGGGRSAKNVHPPWQNPRYAPGYRIVYISVRPWMKTQNLWLPTLHFLRTSVADLDPDPSDPYVLGLLDPDSDPLVRGMDPDPASDSSVTKQNSMKNLDFYCFVTSF